MSPGKIPRSRLCRSSFARAACLRVLRGHAATLRGQLQYLQSHTQKLGANPHKWTRHLQAELARNAQQIQQLQEPRSW
jgi:hypothetical protein